MNTITRVDQRRRGHNNSKGVIMKRVRVNSIYTYDPVGMDLFDPPYDIDQGDSVKVVNLPTCPKANSMGMCHVQHLDGRFAGLVCVGSLIKETA